METDENSVRIHHCDGKGFSTIILINIKLPVTAEMWEGRKDRILPKSGNIHKVLFKEGT